MKAIGSGAFAEQAAAFASGILEKAGASTAVQIRAAKVQPQLHGNWVLCM